MRRQTKVGVVAGVGLAFIIGAGEGTSRRTLQPHEVTRVRAIIHAAISEHVGDLSTQSLQELGQIMRTDQESSGELPSVGIFCPTGSPDQIGFLQKYVERKVKRYLGREGIRATVRGRILVDTTYSGRTETFDPYGLNFTMQGNRRAADW